MLHNVTYMCFLKKKKNKDFPGDSDGKESACNVGDLGLIPGLGRSPGGEHPLEEATHSSILAWIIPMDRRAWWATVHGVTKSWTRLSDTIYRRCHPFLTVYSWLLYCKLLDHIYVGLFLGSLVCSINPCVCFYADATPF